MTFCRMKNKLSALNKKIEGKLQDQDVEDRILLKFMLKNSRKELKKRSRFSKKLLKTDLDVLKRSMGARIGRERSRSVNLKSFDVEIEVRKFNNFNCGLL